MRSTFYTIVVPGVLVLILGACGGRGSATVSTGNTAPVANAGPDQSVLVGETTSLDGSGSSDADGNPLTYLWSIVSTPPGSSITALADHTTAHPSFIPDKEGTFVLQLVVNDGLLDSLPDQVNINAQNCIVDRPYAIVTPITYKCAFDIYSIHIDTFTFSSQGSISTPSPTFHGSLSGAATSCPSGIISHQLIIPGGCTETYTLDGNFTGPNTWSGTFKIVFTGSFCFDCVGSTHAIDATAK